MVTKAQRVALKTILANSNSYDATTIRIGADGLVTAKHDADKTFAGNNPVRFTVGHVDELLARGGV
jgi:hypothetical protein